MDSQETVDSVHPVNSETIKPPQDPANIAGVSTHYILTEQFYHRPIIIVRVPIARPPITPPRNHVIQQQQYAIPVQPYEFI